MLQNDIYITALTCYNCNVTTPDVNQCNTVTCANGEVSEISEIISFKDTALRFFDMTGLEKNFETISPFDVDQYQ
jgi:hypothetical protein